MRLGPVVASLLVLTAPAMAQDTAPPTPGSEDEIKVTGKLVCKMETTIGSMMPRRVCRTKSQSRADERSKEDALARFYEQDRLRKQHMMCKEMGMRC